MPGYSGGPDYKQDYTIWYRESGVTEWSTIPVTPSGSTQVTINRLAPATNYEFQVIGKNALGDGMMSKIITVRTLGKFAWEKENQYPLFEFIYDSVEFRLINFMGYLLNFHVHILFELFAQVWNHGVENGLQNILSLIL